MNPESLGQTLRWARKRTGMTQEDLAAAAQMPQSSVARIERGSVSPRTATFMALLAATGHQMVVEPIGPSVPLEEIRKKLAMAVPARTWAAIGRRLAADPTKTPIRILRRLRRFGVAFVLIGDLAEVAHGSPMKIKPIIEVCHAETAVARERLAQALEGVAESEARRLRLTTETAAGDDYDVLARTAIRMPVDAGLVVPVASLEDLVRVRMARGGAEGKMGAAILRAIGQGGR